MIDYRDYLTVRELKEQLSTLNDDDIVEFLGTQGYLDFCIKVYGLSSYIKKEQKIDD